jgi:Restriction endonuclease NotI
MPSRYGAGELYGFDFSALEAEQIRELSLASHRNIVCPFKPAQLGKPMPKCNKKGGVCSLRLFVQDAEGKVEALGEPVTTCPNRFLEADWVVRWVGETLLETPTPLVISELPFLMGQIQSEAEEAEPDAVGKIDKVLVNAAGERLRWCALEMQAVYFSGTSMENDFQVMREWTGPGVPFPKGHRRPDFRSSGPKRLMPQLQIKVPTISRWGKKMAVIVDSAFWESLGAMRETKELSNCEIVWFVVSFAPGSRGRFVLQRRELHYTTLTNAVEGLTGGIPMSLDRFEREIRARLPRS